MDLVLPDAAWLINQLAGRSADVLVLSMPGRGLKPMEESAQVKRMYSILLNHNAFAFLDSPQQSAASYFIAHAKGFLDQYGKNYRRIIMVGRSGGGWSTTLAAASDERIQCSISFFGTLPLKLRFPIEDEEIDDLGDYEQFGLDLFQTVDYTDLYALATTNGRKHVQVYNEVDDCCFSGSTKGRRVDAIFRESYPTQRGFSTVILPVRSESDHYNLDRSALSVIADQCQLPLNE